MGKRSIYSMKLVKEANRVRYVGNLLFGCRLVGLAIAFVLGILWLAVTVHALQCNAAGRQQDQLIVQMGAPFQLSYLMIVAVPVVASTVWLVMIHMDKCLIDF